MLSVKSVNQYYGQKHILWDINLELYRGQCTCLIGRNGVGKTTLVNCIMGHLPVKSGAISWQSRDEEPQSLLNLPVESRAQMGIGYVPQGRQIFSQMSVDENLQIAMMASRNKTRRVPEEVYDLFPALKEMGTRKAGELDESQQQQLAISRALVQEPELLILDEPTEHTSASMAANMGNIIHRLNRDLGLTLLLVGHKLPFIRSVADRFCLVDGGRDVAQGTLAQLDDQLIKNYLTV
ncbi:ABC transporter ATP-binding protein [Rahnella sp. PAMC25617]|jgi:urea ABC transporter ATP-binding protein UrtE|uniref:ABC transporter ATP-binding protein n=1 Tax=Rahnella TaxID=34037 RepID=UPI000DE8B370|nr:MULTISPECIES: ATP-binding cassette domain-containing protein [Rahnella]MDH2896774.1 ATP-binding cassette domain-containing protein [Rahnella variigena]RBQ33622.1 ABC transporter ATP-binding protein [Rahnella aquatilis]RYJ17366.1 ABC transporter ATP-binding protein [Rahnella variigena]TCQ92973.1 amino acid/amide ABC transporter ATP-binding protein 2 (HAAT family) [Rahnella sp. JUb53]